MGTPCVQFKNQAVMSSLSCAMFNRSKAKLNCLVNNIVTETINFIFNRQGFYIGVFKTFEHEILYTVPYNDSKWSDRIKHNVMKVEPLYHLKIIYSLAEYVSCLFIQLFKNPITLFA